MPWRVDPAKNLDGSPSMMKPVEDCLPIPISGKKHRDPSPSIAYVISPSVMIHRKECGSTAQLNGAISIEINATNPIVSDSRIIEGLVDVIHCIVEDSYVKMAKEEDFTVDEL
jgi:hypothetical protein